MLCNKLKSENELNVNKNIALFPKISDRDFWENAKEYSVDFFEKMFVSMTAKRENILQQPYTDSFI